MSQPDLLSQPGVIVISGKRGTGKTIKALEMIAEIKHGRVVVIANNNDTMGTYASSGVKCQIWHERDTYLEEKLNDLRRTCTALQKAVQDAPYGFTYDTRTILVIEDLKQSQSMLLPLFHNGRHMNMVVIATASDPTMYSQPRFASNVDWILTPHPTEQYEWVISDKSNGWRASARRGTPLTISIPSPRPPSNSPEDSPCSEDLPMRAFILPPPSTPSSSPVQSRSRSQSWSSSGGSECDMYFVATAEDSS